MISFLSLDSKLALRIHRMISVRVFACAMMMCAMSSSGMAQDVDISEEIPQVLETATAVEGDVASTVVREAPPRNPKYFNAERQTLRRTEPKVAPPKTQEVPDLMGTVQRLVFWLVLLALMGVIALAVVKAFLPGGRKLFASAAVEVLGRTYLDSRRYLALIRVGRRVLVVGIDSEGIHPVSEMTDPEEVADILRQAQPATPAGVSFFQSLLQKQMGGVPSKEKALQHREEAGETARLAEAMTGIEEQIRRLRDRD